MKMPNNQSSENGLYDCENTGYFSADAIENNGIDEFNEAAENDDFSEYLWMENEEEFDKEVMQRLEEEALMEECLEAMMEDANSPLGVPSPTTNNDPTSEVSVMISNLKVDRDEVLKSKLNPNAAEFVPGANFSPKVVTSSS